MCCIVWGGRRWVGAVVGGTAGDGEEDGSVAGVLGAGRQNVQRVLQSAGVEWGSGI